MDNLTNGTNSGSSKSNIGQPIQYIRPISCFAYAIHGSTNSIKRKTNKVTESTYSDDNESINESKVFESTDSDDSELINSIKRKTNKVTESIFSDDNKSINESINSETTNLNNLLLNLKNKDKWLLKLNLNSKEQIVKLLKDYNKSLISNSEIFNEEELIKNKEQIIKLLTKSPLELDKESNDAKFIINIDNKLKIEIIDQLIKNQLFIIDFKKLIDEDFKTELKTENKDLIKKLEDLDEIYLNNDVNLIDHETESRGNRLNTINKSTNESDAIKLQNQFNNLKRKLDNLKSITLNHNSELKKLKKKSDDVAENINNNKSNDNLDNIEVEDDAHEIVVNGIRQSTLLNPERNALPPDQIIIRYLRSSYEEGGFEHTISYQMIQNEYQTYFNRFYSIFNMQDMLNIHHHVITRLEELINQEFRVTKQYFSGTGGRGAKRVPHYRYLKRIN